MKQTVIDLNEARNKAKPEEAMKAEAKAEADQANSDVNLADAANSVPPADGPLDALVVFYIDVGNLPPFNAEAYIERMKVKFKPALSRLRENVGTLFIPVRNESTRVESLSLKVDSEE